MRLPAVWAGLVASAQVGARSGCSAIGVSQAEQFHVQVTATGQVTVSWAAPHGAREHTRVEEPGLLSAEGRGVRLQVRSVNTTVVTEVVPEAQRYFHRCGDLQEDVMIGYKCKFAEYRSPTLLHAAVPLSGAAEYRVVSAKGTALSPFRRIAAPPAPGAKQLRLVVLGDIGQTEHSAKTCNALRTLHKQKPIDAAVLLGDLAYSDGNGTRWDTFQRMFDREGCADVPWLVMAGNHDMEPDDLSREAFLPLRARWRTPQVQPGPGIVNTDFRVDDAEKYVYNSKYDFGGSFYSTEIGPVHFVVLDPYTSSAPESPQIQWLKKDLTTVDRDRTPYLLVFTHAPFHHSATVHRPEVEEATGNLRAAAEPLLRAAKAEAMFSGHVHAYERTHPVHGIRYFVVGNGGNREELVNSFMEEGVMEESDNGTGLAAHTDGTNYGLGLLEIDAATSAAATWTLFRNDLQVLDHAEIPSRARPESRAMLRGGLEPTSTDGDPVPPRKDPDAAEKNVDTALEQLRRIRHDAEAHRGLAASLLERSSRVRGALRAPDDDAYAAVRAADAAVGRPNGTLPPQDDGAPPQTTTSPPAYHERTPREQEIFDRGDDIRFLLGDDI